MPDLPEGVRVALPEPAWYAPRLFGVPDLKIEITIGVNETGGDCSFGCRILEDGTDEPLALWVHTSWPFEHAEELARAGLEEALRAVRRLR